MRIYTKKGDSGTTSLIGGTRVSKAHLRIECYGTVDELNSWLGVIQDQELVKTEIKFIQNVQNQLFTIGSWLAVDPEKSKMQLPQLSAALVVDLESSMDSWDKILPELKHFILPGGCLAGSYAHVARCVCRRAERLCVALSETAQLPNEVLPFLNRLSDWLFVYARILNHRSGGQEVPWQPAKS